MATGAKKRRNKRKHGNGQAPELHELTRKGYIKELRRLQVELLQLEEWIRVEGLRVVVIFEGRDTAGKGGVIKRITALLNPRYVRVVALPAPTEKEHTQWYFQRYIAHLPAAGEMVLFDRSCTTARALSGSWASVRTRSTKSSCARVPSSSACSSVPESRSSSTGFRSATRNRSVDSWLASATPASDGS